MGNERLGRIQAENYLKKAVEDAMRQAVADTLDRVRQVEVEREVERQAMREEAS